MSVNESEKRILSAQTFATSIDKRSADDRDSLILV
jgi:hypothetical protein